MLTGQDMAEGFKRQDRRPMLMLAAVLALAPLEASEPVLTPQIDGAWWQIAGNPDLGPFTTPRQQPVDFAIWQAADGSWQLWSCIRGTACGGKTRLFYRWQSNKLTDPDWQPMGIALEADPSVGEIPGGLQAPYVLRAGREFYMFYGDWEHICMARSKDGKTFVRHLGPDGKSGLFGEGRGANTRDPMLIRTGKLFRIYYTAHPNHEGADYVRTSKNLRTWSASKKVAFSGGAGTGPSSAECPFVYHHPISGYFYLFRTQRYGENAQTSIYRSKNPEDFGINDDRYLVSTLPIAAPEIIQDKGQLYIAALLPSLKGIRMARLTFVPAQAPR